MRDDFNGSLWLVEMLSIDFEIDLIQSTLLNLAETKPWTPFTVAATQPRLLSQSAIISQFCSIDSREADIYESRKLLHKQKSVAAGIN